MTSDDRSLIRRIAGRTRREVRRGIGTLRWLLQDVPRAPGLELYGWRQARANKRFFHARREDAAAGQDLSLSAYAPKVIPKTLWIYWAQGEVKAPGVVRHCIDSWRRHNPGWEIRVLDADGAAAFADVSDVPDFLPRRFRADLLRLRLLARYGGVWTDATTLCHRPLDTWLPLHVGSGFFVFSDPGPERLFDNWFIASEPGGALITAWEQAYGAFVTRLTRQPRPYFMMIYALQRQILRDPDLLAAWRRTARLPAPPTFLLMSALKGLTPQAIAHDVVHSGLPLSKLSWKTDLSDAEFESRLYEILPGSGPATFTQVHSDASGGRAAQAGD